MTVPIAVLLAAALQTAAPQTAVPAAADAPLKMKTYQMVFLRQGSAPEPTGPDADKLQAAHLAYLTGLLEKRVNLLFGPFTDTADPRGLLVLDVPDAEAARAALAADPHVASGHLTVEVRPWMGPDGWFHPPADTNVAHPEALEQLVFGILKRGPNRSQSPAEAQELQKGHLAYMDGLHKAGKLIMAGPFLEEGDWRGVVVYRVATVDEARALAAGDPMVKAGRLVVDARPWMTFRGILK